MKEQVSVEHINYSCPNCVHGKMYQLENTDGQTVTIKSNYPVVLTLPGYTQIKTDELERLKRLEENVNNKLAFFKAGKEKGLYYEDLITLLERLDK